MSPCAADDGNGGVDTQSFSIDVAAANQLPTIVSSPSTSGTEGSPYSYDVDATDPDGDVPTYSLDLAPAGMTIDPVSGIVQWTPTGTQLGPNDVTVRADDGNGGVDTQSFSIDVAAANQLPTIVSSPSTSGTEGSPYSYDVRCHRS